jgi:hypothetical protein
MSIAFLNLAGLAIEIIGVIILSYVDHEERNVLDARERHKSAHYVTLENPDHQMSRRYLDGRQGQEDERAFSSYEPRIGSRKIRLALGFLGVGMLLQFLAALIQACASNA